MDTVITSPPYYALRNYGVSKQIGLESNVDGWVSELRAVLRDVARVLKPTGSLWLNLGDTLSHHIRSGAPAKSLLLAPERLALAMIEDGWRIRSKVIWAKTNPMPTSVRDRLSCSYEVVYFATRNRSTSSTSMPSAFRTVRRSRSRASHRLDVPSMPFVPSGLDRWRGATSASTAPRRRGVLAILLARTPAMSGTSLPATTAVCTTPCSRNNSSPDLYSAVVPSASALSAACRGNENEPARSATLRSSVSCKRSARVWPASDRGSFSIRSSVRGPRPSPRSGTGGTGWVLRSTRSSRRWRSDASRLNVPSDRAMNVRRRGSRLWRREPRRWHAA